MEKQHPPISVVMPVYNAEPFLRETVESILRQTFRDFEFIIIDDGSSDQSWSILSEYASRDERIHLIRHEKNLGAVETSNELLGLARGTYIARQDHDDIALPGRLEKQLEFMTNHPEVGLLGTAYYRMNAKGEFSLRTPPESHTGIRWHLLFDCVFCQASIMIRRSVLQPNEGYVFYSGAGDFELWARLGERTQCSTFPEPLVIYRELGPNSMTVKLGDGPKIGSNQISEQQIRALLPGIFHDNFDLYRFRKLRSPKTFDRQDAEYAVPMFELFRVFERQKNIDPSVVRELRRDWIRRAIIYAVRYHWREKWCYQFIARCLSEDPVSPIRTITSVFEKLFLNVRRLIKPGSPEGLKNLADILKPGGISTSDSQLQRRSL